VTGRRIIYVINGFDPGGAEHGLLTLLQNEFFAGHELKILAFCRGRGALSSRITSAAGASNVVLVSEETRLTPRALLAGARALWREHRQWKPDLVVLSLAYAAGWFFRFELAILLYWSEVLLVTWPLVGLVVDAGAVAILAAAAVASASRAGSVLVLLELLVVPWLAMRRGRDEPGPARVDGQHGAAENRPSLTMGRGEPSPQRLPAPECGADRRPAEA